MDSINHFSKHAARELTGHKKKVGQVAAWHHHGTIPFLTVAAWHQGAVPFLTCSLPPSTDLEPILEPQREEAGLR